MIVKRDGRRQPYDAGKVRNALRTACRKRPVPTDVIEQIVDRVGAALAMSGDREAASTTIGEALLAELEAVDEVSYARFASVFLRFESLADFVALHGER